MELLRDLDQVAYVRFASVYREFKDVRDFDDELEPILAETAKTVGARGVATDDGIGKVSLVGAGIEAVFGGKTVSLGKPDNAAAEKFKEGGLTAVSMKIDGRECAVFGLSDTVRRSAKTACCNKHGCNGAVRYRTPCICGIGRCMC